MFDTLGIVTTDDRTFTLPAFSGTSPRPDFNLTPAGILADTVGTTQGGERIFASQTYDRAETIYLRVRDSTGEQFFSDLVVVKPAPAAAVQLWAETIECDLSVTALREIEDLGNATNHVTIGTDWTRISPRAIAHAEAEGSGRVIDP